MIRRKLTNLRCFAALSFAAIAALASNAIAQPDQLAERPDTEHLLPESTVGFLKLRDFREFIEKIEDSSAGQMTRSDSVAPLVESLYEHATKMYDSVSDKVGLSLEQVQSLPTGEITVAWISPRRSNHMAFVVMIETDKKEMVKKWLDRGRDLYEEKTGTKTESEENKFAIEIETVWNPINGQPSYFAYHDGLLIGSTSKQDLEDISTRWAGGEVAKIRPLFENRKFARISKRCAVSDDLLPDLRFYADPIRTFQLVARGNRRMQLGVALLPALGLDGVLAVGGNVFISHKNYEWISHGHLLLALPKEGVLNALALKPDDYTPEPWVPVELAQYMTTSLDVPQMMASLAEVKKRVEAGRLAYAHGRFESAHEAERKASDEVVDVLYEKFFEHMQKELEDRKVDLDIRANLIAHLSGRVTVVRPILSGSQLNGIGNAISLGLRDTESLEESLQKLMAIKDLAKRYSQREYRGLKFWRASEEAVKNAKEKVNLRQRKIAFGIIGDQFVISDSEEFFEIAIDTFNGDRLPLANDEAFLKHVGATKLLRTDLSAAVFYFDSIGTLDFYLNAFGQDGVIEMLESQTLSDETGFISVLKDSIEEHGIPAIEEIKKYLSTCGGFVTTDDSGYHFLFFQERP